MSMVASTGMTVSASNENAPSGRPTNLPFKDWGKLFHNSAAAAIADRFVHKGLLIRIAGKSKRSDREVDAAA